MLVWELAALKADVHYWLTDPKYAALKHRLEDTHAAVEAAVVEARSRVRMNEKRRGGGEDRFECEPRKLM